MKRLLFLIFLTSLIPGCYVATSTTYPPVVVNEDRSPPPPAPVVHKRSYYYQYYPEAQVYYDTRRRVYFYNNRGQWRKAVRLPGYIQLSDYVNLTMYTDLPYTKFHLHRNQYPGRQVYVYHYFPRANVYYYPDRSLYFYQSRGRWLRSSRLPRHIRIRPNRHVVLESERKRPYLDNRQHSRRYANWRPNRGRSYAYHYYPDNEVYFDPRRRIYFYFDNGRWHEVRRLPRRIRLDHSHRVDISHEHNYRPYDAHQEHRHQYRPKHRNGRPMHAYNYWYYPDSEYYYDDKRRLYFYRQGRSWRQTRHLPRHIHKSSHRVRLNLASTRPYEEFQQHRRRYPGKTRFRSIGHKPGQVTPAPQRPHRNRNEQMENMQNDASQSNRHRGNEGRHQNRNRDEDMAGQSDHTAQNHRRQDRRQNRNRDEDMANQSAHSREDRRQGKDRDRHQPSNMVSSHVSRGNVPSPVHNPAGLPPAKAMRNFRYYPDAQVYFDPQRRVYFEKRGKRWAQTKRRPNSLRRHGRSVDVSSASSNPYLEHQSHMSAHPPKGDSKRGKDNKRDKHEDDEPSRGRGKR